MPDKRPVPSGGTPPDAIGLLERRDAIDAMAKNGTPEVVTILVQAIETLKDDQIHDFCKKALRNLELPSARDELCRLVIEEDNQVARAIALEAKFAPTDEFHRALFFFITFQWAEYEALDFDARLIRLAYRTANETVKARVAATARSAGRMEWLGIVSDGRPLRSVSDLTDKDWETTVDVLVNSERWKELWQLAQEAPAKWSVQLLKRFLQSGARWRPNGTLAESRFQELLWLADKCQLTIGKARLRKNLGGHTKGVNCLAFTPNSELLVTGGGRGDGNLRFWKTSTGKLVETIGFPKTLSAFDSQYNSRSINRLVISPDGGFLTSGNGSNYADGSKIHFCQLGGKRRDRIKLRDCPESFSGSDVLLLETTQNGSTAISGDCRGRIELWNVADCRMVRSFQAHSGDIKCLKVMPDGDVFVSVGREGAIRFWSISDPQHVWTRNRLVSLSSSLFHFIEQSPIRFLRAITEFLCKNICGITKVDSLALSPEGDVVATGMEDETIRLWNATDGKLRTRLRSTTRFTHWLQRLLGRVASIECLAVTPDGQILVSGSRDGKIRFWSISEGRLLRTLDAHSSAVSCFAVAPNGRLLISGGRDKTVRIWSFPDGRLIQNLEGYSTCLAISPDGQLLAIGDGAEKHVELWELPSLPITKKPVRRITSEELAELELALKNQSIESNERHWFEFLVLMVRWNQRFDLEVSDISSHVSVGPFDIEISV